MIHTLELGPWFRYVRVVLGILAVAALVVWYNARSFHNLNTQEGMDAAQVGRNLAEGKGFTTLFIRPFSMYLVKRHNEARLGAAAPSQRPDYERIKEMHPDLANPPVYPLALAGAMKVLPFRYAVDIKKPFWSIPSVRPTPENPRQFWRYQPDFLITLFNQFLFLAVVVATFFLTRKLFDAGVAWMSTVLLLGCEVLWRFSTSGLSTMLLLLIFTGLSWCLVLIEGGARDAKWSLRRLFLLAATAGLLTGLGALTRYSFGFVIIPVVVFLALFGGTRRPALCVAAVGVFVLVLTPWVMRNWHLSGTPFGTPTFALVEGTGFFTENRLARSLSPDFRRMAVMPIFFKLLANSRTILQNELPKLGGNWAAAFFLVGLLLAFNNLAIRRLRYFLMGTLTTLVIVQALGRTQLSEDSPEINSENLLILAVPLVLVYGTALFFMLLDQMNFPFRQIRYAVIGAFGLVMCVPMICTFLPPKGMPIAYPPYYPPRIQQAGYWMKPEELMMSDVPWAMAWYGQRQCLWLTPDAQEQFFAVNDFIKPVRGLYLTTLTMDGRFLSGLVRAGGESWGNFVVNTMIKQQIPANFPLRHAGPGYLPEQLFLADRVRWSVGSTPAAKP